MPACHRYIHTYCNDENMDSDQVEIQEYQGAILGWERIGLPTVVGTVHAYESGFLRIDARLA